MNNSRKFKNYASYIGNQVSSGKPISPAEYRDFYKQLKIYYMSNGAYEILNELTTTRISNKDIKPLRNPANRVVEFYAALLWPGHDLETDMPIAAEKDVILDPIYQIYKWSNFATRKQRAARSFATLGDMVIKINTKKNAAGDVTAVYQSFLDPTYVSEIQTDERGFVTYIRLDIPRWEERGGMDVEKTHTEVWSKERQDYRVWLHEKGMDEEIDNLETPDSSDTFANAFGADFVPFVYQEFRDDGNGRGNGAFTAALDKIDEINAKATRLAQLLFRHGKADMALTSDVVDKTGRPLPAPNTAAITTTGETVTIQGEKFWKLPSGWDIKHLIANIDYESHLSAIRADMDELQQDLPELAYNRISEASDLSGRALRYMLEAAVSRLLEARGNGESAFVRANEMSLTIGQNLGLFSDLGTFENGDFNHTFKARPVLVPDMGEMADTAAAWTNAGATNFVEVAKRVGVPEETAVAMGRSDLEPASLPGDAPR